MSNILTVNCGAANMGASPHWDTGSRNLVCRYGEKSPQPIAAFLCSSIFSAALSRQIIMAGCFGQRSALAAPYRSFRPHYSPSPDSVETISAGYSLLDMESTVMTTQATGKIRLSIPTLLNKTRTAFDLPRPFKPRVLIYKTESGAFDIINQADGKHGVTPEQREFMLETIAMHGGIVGGVA